MNARNDSREHLESIFSLFFSLLFCFFFFFFFFVLKRDFLIPAFGASALRVAIVHIQNFDVQELG